MENSPALLKQLSISNFRRGQWLLKGRLWGKRFSKNHKHSRFFMNETLNKYK